MIKKSLVIREYQLYDENHDAVGIIKTSYPLLQYHKVLSENEFETMEDLKTYLISEGYCAEVLPVLDGNNKYVSNLSGLAGSKCCKSE